MIRIAATLLRPMTLVVRWRFLILELAKRDVQMRYRGSALGIAWTIGNPLLNLAMFSFVFGVVFKARWNDPRSNDAAFPLILFAGLIVYWLFAEAVAKAPALVVGNASYVKRVVFPLEILPVVAVLSALFHAAIAFVILLLAHLALFGMPPATALFLPAILAPLLLVTVGCCWLISALAVYLRDLGQIVGVLLSVTMFLSPILYPLDQVPEAMRPLLYLNPLTFVVEEVRRVVLWGGMPAWGPLAASLVGGWLFAALSALVFRRLRQGFADAL
jgi:lipopolysaccharide transport system permease protein